MYVDEQKTDGIEEYECKWKCEHRRTQFDLEIWKAAIAKPDERYLHPGADKDVPLRDRILFYCVSNHSNILAQTKSSSVGS